MFVVKIHQHVIDYNFVVCIQTSNIGVFYLEGSNPVSVFKIQNYNTITLCCNVT